APNGTTLVYVDPSIRNEMFHEFNVIGQWQFRKNWLAEVGYVGNRGRNLLTVQDISSNSNTGGFPGSPPLSRTATVQAIRYNGDSSYDSLQTKLERRYSGGLSLLATYVWSRARDNSPGNFCGRGTGPSSCGFSNPLRPEIDEGPSDFDVPHRFNFSNVWDLPIGKGRRY